MMKKKYMFSIVLFTSLALNAQNGILDQTFGTNGIVKIDIGNANNVMKSIETQSDEKIVMAGYSSSSNEDNVCVVRLNPDGSFDTTFGNGGIVITSLPFTSIASDIKLQTDGKILAGGHTWGGSYNQFALIRYLNNGTLDTSFGNAGVVTTAFNIKNGAAKSMVVQDDGKIILAGITFSFNSDFDDFTMVRYNTNGTIDTTFGVDGVVIPNFGLSKDWINKIVLQPDGKIIAAGFINDAMALARFLPDGSLDASFGSNGLVTTFIQNTSQSIINSLAVAEDGSIFTCGLSNDSYSNSTLAKYDSLGNLDTTFGSGGILINNLDAQQDVYQDIKLMNGKIVVGGTANNNGTLVFSVSQLNVDGTPEITFGTNGTVFTALSSDFNNLEAIKIDADGNILAAGFCENFPYDIGAIRLISDTLLSVNEPNPSDDFTIYPNPTSDYIIIKSTLHHSNVNLKVYDNLGKLIIERSNIEFNTTSNQLMINLEALSGGVYYLYVDNIPQLNTPYKIVKK